MHRAGQRCFELLALIGSPQLLLQSYSPAGQDSWPNWTNLEGLHSGRGFLGNKRLFTCGTKKNNWKNRCPALCILWLELLCSCRVGGWSGHLTASGSRYDFPGVDHEGRQTCRLWFPWSHKGSPCSWDSLWLSLLQGFSDFFTSWF